VSLLRKPESGLKRARGVYYCCGSALRFVVSLFCTPDSGFKRSRGVLVLPSEDLWFRCCYASRKAVSNVPVFWFCPPICGIVVMPTGQRLPVCPAVFGSALRFVVSLLCQPDNGLKGAWGVVVLPSDSWCRCYASRTVVPTVPGVLCSALAFRFVVSLCQPDIGFKGARGVVVVPSASWCRCYTCRTVVSHVPEMLCSA